MPLAPRRTFLGGTFAIVGHAAETTAPAHAPSHAAVAGTILIGLGVLGSLLVFVHDAGRLRAESVHPQLAPKRVAPEAHFLAAVIAGIGAGLVWSWGGGLAWFLGHLLAGVVVVPLVLRAIRWRRSQEPIA